MEYIIPAASAIVVAVIEALAARDRSRAKKQAETLKRHITDGEIGVYSWGIYVGVWNLGFVNRFTYE